MMAKNKKYLFTWTPSFDGWENLSGEDFCRLREQAWSYYYDEMKPKDLVMNIFEWMEVQGYTKEEIKYAKLGPFDTTMGIVSTLLLNGCPSYYDKHDEYWRSMPGTSGKIRPLEEYLREQIAIGIEKGKLREPTEEMPQKEISVQEHMREQLETLFDYIEGYLDEWIKGNSVTNFKPYEAMKSYSVEIKPAHARMILNDYTNLLQEARDLCDGDEELNEGYSGVTKKRRLQVLAMLEKLENACNMIIDSGKQNRKPRKKKSVSKEKLVAKVNYQKQDNELSIVSINPIELLDAKEIWVYNTKYRQLGKYVADSMIGSMSLKGSTIQGFDASKSLSKTLRKPEEVLKEFKNSGKVKLRKFLDDINSKPKQLTGRLNKDTILLKTIH